MKQVCFFVPGQPEGKRRHRARRQGSHVKIFSDPKTVAYEARVAMAARRAAMRIRFAEPVSVHIVAMRRRPKAPNYQHEVFSAPLIDGRRSCTSGPDIDNIYKTILDGINQSSIWKDDRLVVELTGVSVWANDGEEPRVDVTITEMEVE